MVAPASIRCVENPTFDYTVRSVSSNVTAEEKDKIFTGNITVEQDIRWLQICNGHAPYQLITKNKKMFYNKV